MARGGSLKTRNRRAASNTPFDEGTNVNVASWCAWSEKMLRAPSQSTESGTTSTACTTESPLR